MDCWSRHMILGFFFKIQFIGTLLPLWSRKWYSLIDFFLLKVVTFFEMTTIVQIKGKPTHVTCCTKQDFCHPIMCCTSHINVQVSKHIRKEVR